MVITGGPEGCLYLTAGSEGHVAGFSVDAVDTTGAGDGFVAGILQGLVRDHGIVRDEARLRELVPVRQCGRSARHDRTWRDSCYADARTRFIGC